MKICLVIWGESSVVPTLFTLRRKRKTPDWLSSYNTTGLADLCADFDANEVDKVDFESESSCWSDSSTDDCRNCLYFELGACSGYTFTLMLATQLKDNQGNVGWRCLYYTETNIKNNVVETIPKNKISTCNFNNSISFSCILNLTIWLPSEKIQQIKGFTWSKYREIFYHN